MAVRKLGSEQKEILLFMASVAPGALADHARWPGGGWTWDTPSNTLRLLKGLEGRGYAKEEGGVFTLTDAGREHAQALRKESR